MDLQYLYRQAKEKERQKAIGLGRGSTKTNGKPEEKLEKEEAKKPVEEVTVPPKVAWLQKSGVTWEKLQQWSKEVQKQVMAMPRDKCMRAYFCMPMIPW